MTSIGKRVIHGFALILMVSLPTTTHAAATGTELYLPSVARSPGASGSFWYSTVWIYNPGEQSAQLTVSLLRRDRANPAPEGQLMAVEPGRTITVGDVLWDLFGIEQGAGALRITSDVQVVVSARVFNLPGTEIAESQGQFFAGLPAEIAVAMGESTDIPGVTQPADGSFRCNFGLVETRGEAVEVRVVLVNGDGVEQAERTYSMGPYEAIQKGLSDLAGQTRVDGGRLNISVTTGQGAVLGFASMIGNGNVSQDPSTLEMGFDLDITVGAGSITAVSAGPGLIGGGDEGEVTLAVGAGSGIEVLEHAVAIAEGGVTGESIADGEVVKGLAVSGQVLRDEISLVAGENVVLEVTEQSVEISAPTVATQYLLDVTTTTGAWTTERAVGVPYKTSDGSWRLQFNVAGRTWSAEDEITVIFDGVVFKNVDRYEQAVTVFVTGIAAFAYTVPGQSHIEVEVPTPSGRSRFSLSGDVELEGRPAFVE